MVASSVRFSWISNGPNLLPFQTFFVFISNLKDSFCWSKACLFVSIEFIGTLVLFYIMLLFVFCYSIFPGSCFCLFHFLTAMILYALCNGQYCDYFLYSVGTIFRIACWLYRKFGKISKTLHLIRGSHCASTSSFLAIIS